MKTTCVFFIDFWSVSADFLWNQQFIRPYDRFFQKTYGLRGEDFADSVRLIPFQCKPNANIGTQKGYRPVCENL